jgi:hypothetical protein
MRNSTLGVGVTARRGFSPDAGIRRAWEVGFTATARAWEVGFASSTRAWEVGFAPDGTVDA